jgi:16S rRNA (guanine(527)-N(7))-methyltransferase RsmG
MKNEGRELARRTASRWQEVARIQVLTDKQKSQLERYSELLLQENEKFNLTAITDQAGVVRHHFLDSFMVGQKMDFSAITSIADVGTGAGFPGLALKVIYPHLKVLLIETNQKKQKFLRRVAAELGLSDVEVCPYDWRTFLRTTEGEIDLFVSRAALSTRELARVFKPSSAYNKCTLLYWASTGWEPEKDVAPLVQERWQYKIGSKDRVIAVLRKPA